MARVPAPRRPSSAARGRTPGDSLSEQVRRKVEADLRFRARWRAENRSRDGPYGFKLADIAVRYGLTRAQLRGIRRAVENPGGTGSAG